MDGRGKPGHEGVLYGPGFAAHRFARATRRAASGTRRSILRRLLAVGAALRRAGEDLLGYQPGVLPDRGLDLRRHVGIGLQEGLGVLAALAQALAVIGEP